MGYNYHHLYTMYLVGIYTYLLTPPVVHTTYSPYIYGTYKKLKALN